MSYIDHKDEMMECAFVENPPFCGAAIQSVKSTLGQLVNIFARDLMIKINIFASDDDLIFMYIGSCALAFRGFLV